LKFFLLRPFGPAKRFLKAGITNRYEVFLVQAHFSQADLPTAHDRSGGKNYAGARGQLARLADRRIAIIFGPVLDPDGAFGIAIVEAKDEIVILEIGKNDPAIKAEVGSKSEHYSMPDPILRG
jgi:hypothetical protein